MLQHNDTTIHYWHQINCMYTNQHTRYTASVMEHAVNSTANHIAKREDASSQTNYRVPLPFVRFTNVCLALTISDLVVLNCLWLAGGDTSYMEDHVKHFNFKTSVVELAILAVIKAVLIIYLLDEIEKSSLASLDAPYEDKVRRQSKTLQALFILTTSVCFVYSAVKGVMVYLAWRDNEIKMHRLYYAVVIASISFCFLEWSASVLCRYSMRKLLRYVVARRKKFSDNGGKEKKRKVDLRRLASLAKSEYGILFLAILALFISSGSQMAAPLFFGRVINAANNAHIDGIGPMNKQVIILFCIYVVGAIGSLVRSWLFTLSGQRLVARIRCQVFNAIARQGVSFFDSSRTGELINRLSSDTQVIQNAVTVNVSMLARFSLQIIGSLVIMFVLCPKLTAVLISVVPIIGIGAQRYGQYLKNLRKVFQDKLASSSTTAEETFSSIRTVRSFSQEKKAMDLYKLDIDGTYEVGKKIAAVTGVFNGAVGIIAQGAICLVLWYGSKLVYDGELTVGILTAFMLYTLNVAMAFAFLSSLFGDFMQAVGASFRIFDLLDQEPEIRLSGGLVLPSAQVTLSFENVSFSYPTREDTKVLKNISFSIEPGQTVALVGPSGGGKSTIINLIERFYDPDSGRIMLGRTPLTDVDPEWFRKKISLVGQEPVLFGITIAENIAYGRDATQAEIEDAAKQANAHSFIMSFEDGYATQVGERGIKLSGGQKQRVAISRALLMNPDILLLDEATSALDSESEHLVKEAIDRAMQNRTVLVIAHRLSTVKNASKVVVIDNGTIVEEGGHKELLAQDGVYKQLVYRQLAIEENEET